MARVVPPSAMGTKPTWELMPESMSRWPKHISGPTELCTQVKL